MPRAVIRTALAEHARENVMDELGDVARFYDRCSDLMRELLDELAGAPDRPRPFPEIEDAIGWPHRRIASVLGGVSHLRHTEFGGLRPYHFHDCRQSASGRWEMWMDRAQAQAVLADSERGLGATPVPSSAVPTCSRVAGPRRKRLSVRQIRARD